MASKKPDKPLKVSSPKRVSTQKFNATWSLPSTAKKGDDKAYDQQMVHWRATTSTLKNGKWVQNAEDTTLRWVKRGPTATDDNLKPDWFKRANYYPIKNVRLLALHFAAEGQNNCGTAMTKFEHLYFKPPKKPTIDFDFDQNGLLTITVKSPKDNIYDRYSWDYKVVREDTETRSSLYKGKPKYVYGTDGKILVGTETHESKVFYTKVNQLELADGASISFTVTVTAKGFAGDSTATKTFVMDTPIQTKITKINLTCKDTLSLIRNIDYVQFMTGVVQVWYAAKGEQDVSGIYDVKYPTEYSLERLVSEYKVNTPAKAMVQSGWSEVDTNSGTPSDDPNDPSKFPYRKKADRYTQIKYQYKDKVQYYTCTERNSNGDYIQGTTEYPAWKIPAMKKQRVGDWAKYADFQPSSKKKVYWYKAYDKKTKKWVTDIRPWNLSEYKKATYTNGKKSVKRYKNFAKSGKHFVNFYKAYDNQNDVFISDIPKWSLVDYQKATYVKVSSASDGMMGESIVDVLGDMGATATGGIFNKRVWYRIKSTKFGIVEYSAPMEAKEFRAPVPTASKDYAGFMRIGQNPKNPGTSIVGTVGWDNADKTDEGVDNPNWKDAKWTTIVEWSEYSNAPKSNQEPSKIEINWKNSKKTMAVRQKEYTRAVKNGTFGTKVSGYAYDKVVSWKTNADFTIYGLTPGVPIYLWTYRHMVLDAFDEYGPRSSAPVKPKGYFPFTPIDNPTAVTCYIPDTYIVGNSLTVSWAHNATCPQTAWNVYIVPGEAKWLSKNVTSGLSNASKIPKRLVASGTGRTSSTTIAAKTISANLGEKACVYMDKGVKKAFSIKKRLAIVVGVSTGGKEVLSCQDTMGKYTSYKTASIVHAPKLHMYIDTTWTTADERIILLFTNSEKFYAVVNCYATHDTTLYLPDGEHRQVEGECVWNTTVQGTKFKDKDSVLNDLQKKSTTIKTYLDQYEHVALIKIPVKKQDLYDGSTYRFEAYAVSTVDESVTSEPMERTVTCNYKHQAAFPGITSRVQGYLEGYRERYKNQALVRGVSVKEEAYIPPPTAFIYCAKPSSGYVDGDKCRVYRITPDGGDLIADNVPFERIVVDRYAPFSKFAITRYTLATVTKVGDMCTMDVNYSLRRHGMRFDWGPLDDERSVELPFDIELNESYAKNYRIDTYMDGSVNAHFNLGVTKTETANTKLVRLQDPVQFELVKDLANYPGTAFFRAHDGSAYECVVEVNGLANNFDSQVSPVSFNLTQVTLTDRFKPQPYDVTMQMTNVAAQPLESSSE